MDFDDIHTHPGGGQPPVKAKDLQGKERLSYLVVSNELQASADTEQIGTESSYTTIKEIQIYRPGVVRVKYEAKDEPGTSGAFSRLYVDNTEIHEKTLVDSTYTEYSEDVNVFAGSSVIVKAKTNNTNTPYYIKNFKIYFDINQTEEEYEIITD